MKESPDQAKRARLCTGRWLAVCGPEAVPFPHSSGADVAMTRLAPLLAAPSIHLPT